MSLLLRGIRTLVTWDEERPVLTDAALVVDGGRVAWSGPTTAAPPCDEVVDCADGTVIPGFVDSHTHLVFGGDRTEEFEA
ncbi:MAG: imidazolonepropionase, partial [Candidatus Limnocylindrales bacterium]